MIPFARFALILILPLSLAGCATGSATRFEASTRFFQCDELTSMQISPIPISGWGVPYYVVPLWYSRWDHSKDNLVFPLYLSTQRQPETIKADTLVLTNTLTGQEYAATSAILTSHVPYQDKHFLMYDIVFPIQREQLNNFTISFTAPIYGCQPPKLLFDRSSSGYNERLL